MSDDLVTWLRAKLDYDERAITETLFNDPCDRSGHWDDDRLLREIDAKRRILDLAEVAAQHMVMDVGYDPVARLKKSLAKVTAPEFERVTRLLALPYASRAGYREEWRPCEPA